MKQKLSENTGKSALTISQAADLAKVSTVTIRNWIKTGYLTKNPDGLIDKKDIDTFLTTVAGKEKLLARANKSHKDFHNHCNLNKIILEKLDKTNANEIGEIYEAELSNSYKNQQGIYYTPDFIVSDMLCNDVKVAENQVFCDPCCGSGNFIMQALELGFKPENIYGFDTDSVAVEITQKRIFAKTGHKSKTIKCLDFLDFAADAQIKFDYIFTNPPWGKKLSKVEKQKYATIFKTGKSVDTCSLFFFASLKCLKKNGQLGFLLPEAFFNIASFEQARQKALELKIEKLIDYGKPFKGLITKAQAIILSNKKNKNTNVVCVRKNGEKFIRKAKSFGKMPKSILNFYCNNDDISVIENIFSRPHITLKNNAKWGLGIVTGNNKKFMQTSEREGFMPIFRGADISPQGLSKAEFFIPKNLSLYQQTAPINLYRTKPKLIYKFISSRLCFCCDTNKNFILNSANMLVLDKEFPLTEIQIADLFNSDFMNWIFKNIFNTHKILRSDLETLPIHSEYFKKNKKFNEKSYLNFLNLEAYAQTYRLKK